MLQKETKHRITFLLFLIFVGFSIIIFKLFKLQILDHDFLFKRAEQQQKRTLSLEGRRGNIYDQKGELLATSITVQSLYATPKIIKDKTSLSAKLSPILGISATNIKKKLNNDLLFVWLKRKLNKQETKKIQQLQHPGLNFLPEEKRFYVYDNLASTLLGFTGIDNKGLSGIEFFFNSHLQGKPGKFIMKSDPFGREIFFGKRQLQEPIVGKKLYLTIHNFLQYIAERELKKAIIQNSAKGGCIIILDPYSGDILAMASSPNYNPNYYFNYPIESRKNKTVEIVYEPGSTFKAITIASALNEKIITPKTKISCPDKLKFGGVVINDSHHHKTEEKDIGEILAESLNVGTAKIGLLLGKSKLYKYIKLFGFGQKTGIELSGEASGIVRHPKNWTDSDSAIIPFGHGIAVTPIQLIMAIGAIANGGILYKPNLVKYIESENGKFLQKYPKKQIRRVLRKKVSDKIKRMMIKVTTEGTGKFVKIYGYNVAGKTGTAQKVNPNGAGYLKNTYISSFVGFLPAQKPKAVILVVIDEPIYGKHYGSVCAAPAFKNIAEEAIRYLSIPPKPQAK